MQAFALKDPLRPLNKQTFRRVFDHSSASGNLSGEAAAVLGRRFASDLAKGGGK
jgi:hypothetical protein